MKHEYGTLVEWHLPAKTDVHRDKYVPVPLGKPQIPNGLSSYRTQTSIVQIKCHTSGSVRRSRHGPDSVFFWGGGGGFLPHELAVYFCY